MRGPASFSNRSQTNKRKRYNRVLSDNATKAGTGSSKTAPPVALAAAKQWAREEAEQRLTLAGLLVVDCPLKKDTAGVIAELQVCIYTYMWVCGCGVLWT